MSVEQNLIGGSGMTWILQYGGVYSIWDFVSLDVSQVAESYVEPNPTSSQILRRHNQSHLRRGNHSQILGDSATPLLGAEDDLRQVSRNVERRVRPGCGKRRLSHRRESFG